MPLIRAGHSMPVSSHGVCLDHVLPSQCCSLYVPAVGLLTKKAACKCPCCL